MTIFQILFAGGVVAILGFIAYQFGVFIKAGPKATQEEVNNKEPKI